MTTHTNFEPLAVFNIAASGTQTVSLDLTNAAGDCQLYLTYTYLSTAATSAQTGVICNLTDGVGPTDATGFVFVGSTQTETVYFDSVGTNIFMNPVALNSGTPQTVTTKIPIDMTKTGNWVKLTLGNTDPTYPVSITLNGDF